MEGRTFLVNGVLISLFIISIIAFGIQFADDNDAPISISDNEEINTIDDDLQSQVKDSSGTYESHWTSLGEDTPEDSDLSLLTIPKMVVSIPKTIWNMYKSSLTLMSRVLGIPAIVIYSLQSILLIVVITVIVSLIRSGR